MELSRYAVNVNNMDKSNGENCCPVCKTVSGSYGDPTRLENFKIHINGKARAEAYHRYVLLEKIPTPHIDYLHSITK